MPRLDLSEIAPVNRTGYPAPFDVAVAGRWYRRLAPAGGLKSMGASHVMLKPGAWSSQRHWHSSEDELLVMLAGEAVLVEDADGRQGGETVLRPGDICAWPAGAQTGHHLQNRSDADCSFVVVSAGNGQPDFGEYPDIDLKFDAGGYSRKDGTPYDGARTP